MTDAVPQPVPGVYGLLQDGSSVALLRRRHTGYHDGSLTLPGGHVEKHEDLVDALRRELREELDIHTAREDIELVLVGHRARETPDDYDCLDFYLRVRRWTGSPRLAEPEQASELVWAPVPPGPSDLLPYLRAAFVEIEQGRRYFNYGWE